MIKFPVAAIDELTGYPVSKHGRFLDPSDDYEWAVGSQLSPFTDPYGHMHFAVGDKDAVFMDYATFACARGEFIILDSVYDGESSSYIGNFEYHVLPVNTSQQITAAINDANDLCIRALNTVNRHNTRGHNQDSLYFARYVASKLCPHEFENITDRMLRLGGARVSTAFNKVLLRK